MTYVVVLFMIGYLVYLILGKIRKLKSSWVNPNGIDVKIEHYILDMDSYWKWGNTPDDLYGSKAYSWNPSPLSKRIHPEVQEFLDIMKIGWNNYQNVMLFQPYYQNIYGLRY